MRSLLLAMLCAAAFAFGAPVSAQALPSVGLGPVAGSNEPALLEEARSRRTRVVKRTRRPYYAPYACVAAAPILLLAVLAAGLLIRSSGPQ